MSAESSLLADVDSMAGMLTDGAPLDEGRTQALLEALAAAGDETLGILTGRVECHTARGGTVEGPLAALRSQARGRETKAAVALLAARAAEGAGDCAAASALIDEALTLRPGLEPALHDAAQYAAARGDYPTADRYLRRAECPSSLRPGLTAALALLPDNVPRNDPCPCGSGRKFKACCRRESAPPLAARAELVYALLGAYAERAPGMEMISPLLERTEDAARCGMFLLDLVLFRGGLVERFLAVRGDWLRPDERDLIDHWRQIPATLYEIVEVRRGTGATLRPLPDGAPIALTDTLFSNSAERLELLCGRILHDDAGPRLLALPVHIPRHRRRALLDLLATDPSNEQIADFLGPEPPVRLRNSDGEDLHECRVTYHVPSARQTFDGLAQRLIKIGDNVVAWHRAEPDGRLINLAQLVRNDEDFTVTANSPARLAELETLLHEVAPDAVERDRHIEPLRPGPAPGRDPDRTDPDPEGRDGREARTVVLESYFLPPDSANDAVDAVDAADQLARHAEAGWLDTPGVIGELTPREAATCTDPAVRAELHSMINDVEATLLQTQRIGRPTAGLMNPQRLRDALALSGDAGKP